MELDERPNSERHRRAGTAVRGKGLRRSEEILDAATALLREEGYAQLSTRKIAARAGMQPGNLQYYYRTKQDVVRALLERYLEQSLRAVKLRSAAARGGPAARLRAGIDGILEDQTKGACAMFWELWALSARDAAVARAARTFYQHYQSGVAAALLGAAPHLGRVRASRRAALVVALLEGLTVLRLGTARGRPLDPALRRELHALILHLADGSEP